MALTNCSQCGSLFHSHSGGRRCPECLQAEEDEFQKVLEYLREPGSHTVPAIADATGVSPQLITRWLRQQRVHAELLPGELQCRRCRTPVEGGSFCDECRLALAREVAEQRRLAERVPPPVNPVRNSGTERMHTRTGRDDAS